MRGEPNHRLLADAGYLGEARSAPRFTLHDLGAYPAMAPGGDQAVAGELYSVSAETLARLDRLEGHPTFYRREGIPLEDGSFAEAYLLQPERGAAFPVVASANWRAHRRAAVAAEQHPSATPSDRDPEATGR